MKTLSGLATACVLRQQKNVYADAQIVRIGLISVAQTHRQKPYSADQCCHDQCAKSDLASDTSRFQPHQQCALKRS